LKKITKKIKKFSFINEDIVQNISRNVNKQKSYSKNGLLYPVYFI